MTKILIAFALKEEFAPWRRRHDFRPYSTSQPGVWRSVFGSVEVYATLVGAGARDTDRIRDLTAQIGPSLGIVTGVAAGLKPQWRPGDLLIAHTVCGADGEERIACAPDLIDLASQCGAKPAPLLLTLPRVARTVEEKTRLASSGDAADMESLPVMKEWSTRGIPCLAVRVIVDPVEVPMTCDFESTMDAHRQVQVTRILAQLAHHPQLLPDFLRLARQSRRSLKILATFLDRFFEHLGRQLPAVAPQGKKE
jgi:nucleoside phosphorylase